MYMNIYILRNVRSLIEMFVNLASDKLLFYLLTTI